MVDVNSNPEPWRWSNRSSTATNISMEHSSYQSLLPDTDDLDLHSQILHTALILFYGILILISLIGNGLVCRVLTSFRPSSCPIPQSSSNSTGMSKMLIINLAVSDLLLTTFNIPMNIVRFVSRDWPFGSFICTMMPLIQSISAYCSAWTMMVIAFERYRKIFHPRTLLKLQNMYRKRRANRKLGKLAHAQIIQEHNGDSNPMQCGSDQVEVCLTPTVTMYDSDGYSPIDFHHDKSSQQPPPSKHHQVLWRKISPDICQTIRRGFSYLAYNFCTYCCCCCPIRCIPMPPISMAAFKTTNNNQEAKIGHKKWTLSGCGCRHWSPNGIIAMIWTVSLILSIPHSLYTKIVHHDYVNMTRCTINAYPTMESKHFLTIYTFVTQYILPIGITSFCYIHIGVFLWRRETIGSISERRKKFLLKRKRKRVRLLIMVVATFAICWLPLNLYVLLTDLDYIHHHQILFFLAHWFAMSSVCYNPFIYCWLNEMFRQKMTSILKLFWWKPFLGCCPRQNPATGHCFQCQTALIAIHNDHLRNGGVDRVLEQIINDYHAQHHHHKQSALMIEPSDSGENRSDHHHHQQNLVSLASWSSTTNSGNTTGQQQAIFELRSMTAYLDQQQLQQLDSTETDQPFQQQQQQQQYNNNNNPLVTKEQRLALLTTQAGRRRYHGDQLLMMLDRQSQLQSQSQISQQNQRHHHCGVDAQSSVDSPDVDQITKTTSLNLGSFSSSGSDSDCKTSPRK